MWHHESWRLGLRRSQLGTHTDFSGRVTAIARPRCVKSVYVPNCGGGAEAAEGMDLPGNEIDVVKPTKQESETNLKGQLAAQEIIVRERAEQRNRLSEDEARPK